MSTDLSNFEEPKKAGGRKSGQVRSVRRLVNMKGAAYPDLTLSDWRLKSPRGDICHLHSLSEALAKLGVGRRIEAVKLAEAKGWLAD